MRIKRKLKRKLIQFLLGKLFTIDGVKIQAEDYHFVLKCKSFDVESFGGFKTKIKINGKPFNYATRLVIDMDGESVRPEMTIIGLMREGE